MKRLTDAIRTVLWMGPVGAMLLGLTLLIAASDAAAAARRRRIAASRARRAYQRRPVPWLANPHSALRIPQFRRGGAR